MNRVHQTEFDFETMTYKVYRVVSSKRVILAEIDVRSLLTKDYDQTINDVACAIGEVIFMDSKAGVEAAWQFSRTNE